MAITFAAKAAADTIRYVWKPDLADGDTVSAVTFGASGITVDGSETETDEIVILLSGGTNNTVASLLATVTTGDGETITETIYVPILATTTLLDPTAREVCYYALRKIFGASETPSADALTDALERLNDMLADWKGHGMDVGAKIPLAANDSMSMRDDFLRAIKHNLLIGVHEFYGLPPGQNDVYLAKAGLQLVKQELLPEDRGNPAYY